MISGVSPAAAADSSSPPAQGGDTPDRRWVEIDTFTLYSRYHFVENNAERVTSNNSQYKSSFHAHVNLDPKNRFAVHAGTFTGASFISTWNSLGVGPGDFDPHHHYLKQLYFSAAPHRGWEAQYGSLFVRRGDEDEITSYDDDGYLIGERLTVRRPARALPAIDEVTLTLGEIGPFNEPNAFSRWNDPTHTNYGQVLVMAHANRNITGSLEYMTQSGAHAFHAGVTVRLPRVSPIGTVRYEQYSRMTIHPAAGFALWGERVLPYRIRVQGGYATIDRYFGGWNADRMQNGKRIFAVAAVPLHGGVTIQAFGTQAFTTSYPIPIKHRVDITASYDVLAALHHTGWF